MCWCSLPSMHQAHARSPERSSSGIMIPRHTSRKPPLTPSLAPMESSEQTFGGVRSPFGLGCPCASRNGALANSPGRLRCPLRAAPTWVADQGTRRDHQRADRNLARLTSVVLCQATSDDASRSSVATNSLRQEWALADSYAVGQRRSCWVPPFVLLFQSFLGIPGSSTALIQTLPRHRVNYFPR